MELKNLKPGQIWQRLVGRGKGTKIEIVRVRPDGWITARCSVSNRLVFVQQQSFLKRPRHLYKKIPRHYIRKTCLVTENVVLNKEGNTL